MSALTADDERNLDVLALGEAVVDLISKQTVTSLAEANGFSAFVGGEVTNVALNVVRLGGRAATVVCVGDDGFGVFIKRHLTTAGVVTDYVQTVQDVPTTTVVASRQTATPDFIIHRGSDAYISINALVRKAITDARVVHTSAFALSRDPARAAIQQALEDARAAGCLISLDPNYHPRIWPDTVDLEAVLAETCALVDVAKPSLDDCVRLFGPGMPPADYAQRFLDWGVRVVALTMGHQGVLLKTSSGSAYRIEPEKVRVADVTGAGDAFWSGLLMGLLDGYSPEEAACLGQLVAEIKIRTVGPLPRSIDRCHLYEKLARVKDDILVPLSGS